MKKIEKIWILPAIIMLIVLMSSFTMAFGVAIPYWDSPEWYPLKLAPGESTIVQLVLQNTGEEDMTVKATITGNIARLYDENDEYFVPSGEINKLVNIKVEIPKDAEIGERYKVYSSLQEISSEEGGMIKMTGAFTVNFPVEVVGEEESLLYGEESGSAFNTLILIILGLVILIGVFFIAKKKKTRISK